VCEGDGHSEAVRIEYDPSKLSYQELLDVFFEACDADSHGGKAQYKSAIWYHSDQQREEAKQMAERMRRRRLDIKPPQAWYDAEEEHQCGR